MLNLTLKLLTAISVCATMLSVSEGDTERWSSWFKAPVLKTGDGFCHPWVRIPLFPPPGHAEHAPIAQLDRASGYGPEGCGFDLCWARQGEDSTGDGLSSLFCLIWPLVRVVLNRRRYGVTELEKHEFSTLHPLLKVICFALILGVAMFVDNMVLRGISLTLALAALAANGHPFGNVLKLFSGSLISCVVFAIVNCLISHNGASVIFTVNRTKFTWEAVVFGVSIGLMIAGTAFWCLFITDESSSDDLVYLTGKTLPKFSVLITITLRYIPEIIKTFRETLSAQKMLGVYEGRKFYTRAAVASKTFMTVVERSLEDALETSLAMQAKGFGTRGRTFARHKKWTVRDTVVCAATAAAGVLAVLGNALEWVSFEYYPRVVLKTEGIPGVVTIVMCGVLLAIPAVVTAEGRLRWKIYLSKI